MEMARDRVREMCGVGNGGEGRVKVIGSVLLRRLRDGMCGTMTISLVEATCLGKSGVDPGGSVILWICPEAFPTLIHSTDGACLKPRRWRLVRSNASSSFLSHHNLSNTKEGPRITPLHCPHNSLPAPPELPQEHSPWRHRTWTQCGTH